MAIIVSLVFSSILTPSYAGTIADDIEATNKIIDECNERAKLPGGNGVPVGINDKGLKACVDGALEKLKRFECDNDKLAFKCEEEKNDFIRRMQVNYEISENPNDTKLKERCDNAYASIEDDVKECSKLNMKTARSCFKSASTEDSFMQGETMQMATPFLSMVSGADTLMGMYSAMNDNPSCRLSKEDFRANEEKLDTQKKELEDKIKDNMKDAEEAQSSYSEKLKDWAEQEGKIADRLEAIPGEKEDNTDKLNSEKVKVKMQADAKYNAVVEQMGELRRKYNDMIDAKSVALADNSDFAIHDRCALAATTGGDPNKQKNTATAIPTQAVQNSFSGAFAQGKILTTNIQKRYDSCINSENKKQKRIENTFAREMSAIKSKLQSYDAILGQINEEKRLAEQEIIKQIAKLAVNADKEIRALAREYQRIQADKTNEQSLLKQKLARLESENKKNQQQLAIIGMKLNHYQGKKPPKNNDEKSMEDMMDQCGENFRVKLDNFKIKQQCCTVKDNMGKDKPTGYSGTGSALCEKDYDDFEVDPPKKEKKRRSGSQKTKATDGGKKK